MAQEELLDRLERLEEEARLEHEIAQLPGASRDRFEATLSALIAIKHARAVLANEADETTAVLTGYFVRNVLLHKLGKLILQRTPGTEYPYIGDIEKHRKELAQHDFELEILQQVEGTRREILKQFLMYKKIRYAASQGKPFFY